MAKPAITVSGLWKEYVVGPSLPRQGTFYDLLAEGLKAPFARFRELGGAARQSERFWALRDVSFEIQPGEVVGVIGRNGAGKSTLLKVLSRITAPTRGRVEVRGRLSSLLEVGTGFHPELSGRENIFLNGAILGMTRGEVARKFDEIVAFAEIEKFIDTPVKRYSSGMYVRLAFAVAAHLEPEILVIDEVLAVGDAEFQKRCLGKMQDVSSKGRTVLFVSHNMNAVQVLCPKVLLLDRGEVQSAGDAGPIIRSYLENIEAGSGVVHLNSGALRLVAAGGEAVPADDGMLRTRISLDLEVMEEIADLVVDFGLENAHGVRLVQVVPLARGALPVQVSPGSRPRYEIEFESTMLAPGDYFGTVFAHSRSKGGLLHQTNIRLFHLPSAEHAPESMSAGFTATLVPRYSARLSMGR